MLDESVGEARPSLYHQHLDNLIVCGRHKTDLAERAIPRTVIGCNPT
jgi:hypothetical protein